MLIVQIGACQINGENSSHLTFARILSPSPETTCLFAKGALRSKLQFRKELEGWMAVTSVSSMLDGRRDTLSIGEQPSGERGGSGSSHRRPHCYSGPSAVPTGMQATARV